MRGTIARRLMTKALETLGFTRAEFKTSRKSRIGTHAGKVARNCTMLRRHLKRTFKRTQRYRGSVEPLPTRRLLTTVGHHAFGYGKR